MSDETTAQNVTSLPEPKKSFDRSKIIKIAAATTLVVGGTVLVSKSRKKNKTGLVEAVANAVPTPTD
jgi:hypothetical protein